VAVKRRLTCNCLPQRGTKKHVNLIGNMPFRSKTSSARSLWMWSFLCFFDTFLTSQNRDTHFFQHTSPIRLQICSRPLFRMCYLFLYRIFFIFLSLCFFSRILRKSSCTGLGMPVLGRCMSHFPSGSTNGYRGFFFW